MNKIKIILKKIRAFFPSALPTTMDELNAYTEEVLEVWGISTQDSYRHAIATMIMHLGPTTAYKSKIYFVLSVKKAMANQLAHAKIKELNEAQQKREAAAKLEEAAKHEEEQPTFV